MRFRNWRKKKSVARRTICIANSTIPFSVGAIPRSLFFLLRTFFFIFSFPLDLASVRKNRNPSVTRNHQILLRQKFCAMKLLRILQRGLPRNYSNFLMLHRWCSRAFFILSFSLSLSLFFLFRSPALSALVARVSRARNARDKKREFLNIKCSCLLKKTRRRHNFATNENSLSHVCHAFWCCNSAVELTDIRAICSLFICHVNFWFIQPLLSCSLQPVS